MYNVLQSLGVKPTSHSLLNTRATPKGHWSQPGDWEEHMPQLLASAFRVPRALGWREVPLQYLLDKLVSRLFFPDVTVLPLSGDHQEARATFGGRQHAEIACHYGGYPQFLRIRLCGSRRGPASLGLASCQGSLSCSPKPPNILG